MDKYLKLLEKISEQSEETKECVYDLEKKVCLHIQKSEYEFNSLKEMDKRQNDLLEQHVKRSNMLEELLNKYKEEVSSRLDFLEAPKKWFFGLRAVILWLSGFVGGTVILLKFLEYIRGKQWF